MIKFKSRIVPSVSKNESESETTGVFKSLMDVFTTDSQEQEVAASTTVTANTTPAPSVHPVTPTHGTTIRSGTIISTKKVAFPNFTLFNETTKSKKTRLPPPSELFRTATNSNYFNSTEEELRKEMEEAAAKAKEQSVLSMFFKSLDELKKSKKNNVPEYDVDSFSNVSGLLEELSICLVSDKICDSLKSDNFELANRSFFQSHKIRTTRIRYNLLWFDSFFPSSTKTVLEMHSLLKLFNEIPVLSTFNFKYKPLPTIISTDESASVKKAILFTRLFKNLNRIDTPSTATLISNAQFTFFKTISSSIEISLLGSSAYSLLHNNQYDDRLPLKSFKEDPVFFTRLPNLLLLLFNNVLLGSSLHMPNLLNRNRVVPYSTRTLVFNYISLGNVTLDFSNLPSLRLSEQTNTSFLNKLSTLDTRHLNFFFDRLELSRNLVSKVSTLMLDISTVGLFGNTIFLKLKQLNHDIFTMKQAIAINPASSLDFTTSKKNLSLQARKKRWVIKLNKYSSFLKEASANLLAQQNTTQTNFGVVSLLEVFDQLKEELEAMVIQMTNKITRISKKAKQNDTPLSSFNFENLFNRWRKKDYFLKYHKQKKLLKAAVTTLPKIDAYSTLKKKVSNTSSVYTKLQNTSSSSFFYSLCLDRSRLLSKFRNHLIKKGFKLKATNHFFKILSFIKGTYRVCPVKVLRFLLLRHYKATLVTELFIKKRKVFVPKQLSLRKQIYYMVFSFLKEASLYSNLKNFSYQKNDRKSSRFLVSMEHYIDSLMHNFVDGTSNFLLEKNKLIEEKVYNTKHYLIPSTNSRSRLRKKYSLYSGH